MRDSVAWRVLERIVRFSRFALRIKVLIRELGHCQLISEQGNLLFKIEQRLTGLHKTQERAPDVADKIDSWHFNRTVKN